MTTPDPTPYAAPTDLVTAEDVARWLREQIDEYDIHAIMPPREVLVVTTIALLERLDRERRQACRRGCIAMFREACILREAERDAPVELWRARYHGQRREWLIRALAFRAAARAK